MPINQGPAIRQLRNIANVTQLVRNRLGHQVTQALLQEVQQVDMLLYGGYPKEEVAIIFLYWLVKGDSYSKIDRYTGLPKSNMKQTFGTIRRVLKTPLSALVNFGTYQERAAASLGVVQDDLFAHTTLLLDGVQVRTQYFFTDEEKENLSSKKFKGNNAINFIVVSRLDGKIVYVSPGYGGRRHDFHALKQCASIIKQKTTNQDRFLADAGFIGNLPQDAHLHITTPHKKPRGGSLTGEQADFNHRLSLIRNRIERVFGRLKNTFNLLYKFRGSWERLEEIMIICAGIYNAMLAQEAQNPAAEDD
jgi:hypothetical protein